MGWNRRRMLSMEAIHFFYQKQDPAGQAPSTATLLGDICVTDGQGPCPGSLWLWGRGWHHKVAVGSSSICLRKQELAVPQWLWPPSSGPWGLLGHKPDAKPWAKANSLEPPGRTTPMPGLWATYSPGTHIDTNCLCQYWLIQTIAIYCPNRQKHITFCFSFEK